LVFNCEITGLALESCSDFVRYYGETSDLFKSAPSTQSRADGPVYST